MPKRRNQIPFQKPQATAHPSISRSLGNHNQHNDSFREQDSQRSVNDLLQHLRVSQASSTVSAESRSDVNPQTVHPSLKDILQIPETPPPRPRPGMRTFVNHGRRRPPGPAAPRSWLENSIHAPPYVKRASLQRSRDSQQRPNLDTLEPLPDMYFPDERTLQHQALVQLAKNWDFHVEYDQYYFADLSVRHKQTLLTYIAKYSPNGIDLNGVKTLLLDDSQLDGATGIESLTHLDFAGSIERTLSLKDVKHFFSTISNSPANSISDAPPAAIPESWDSMHPSRTDLSFNGTILTLTHLSLSHPAPTTSWRSLLALTPHLPTLTHLSLAYWPVPSLTPNSTTAYLSTPAGNVSYGTSTLYSHALDHDFSGAASVLRMLSRGTYCLQYLDLTGCAQWVPALAWREGGIEWDGSWSGVQTVKVGQGWLPEVLETEGVQWKKFVFNRQAEAPPAKRARWLQLKRWAAVELAVKEACWKIWSGNARAVAPQREEMGYDRGNTRWGFAGPKNGKGKSGRRIGKVDFDKGWEGWWIEDCLQWHKGSLTRR
ncbi:MAG: hypothetical protein Q9219_000888 [cf. Caloplaca sp. 3 TL-2023]